eukprot:196560_1
MKLIQTLFTTSLVTLSVNSCDTSNPLDIMFIVDSSGSVYDPQYNNWQAELDLVASIVQELPGQSRAGLINFSGCGTSYTLEQCIAADKLKLMIELDEFEPSFNGAHLGLYDKITSIGPEDFNMGWTWTNQALTIALDEFKSKSKPRESIQPDHIIPNRVIVLITDGKPQPIYPGQPDKLDIIPCDATGYVSETVRKLKDELRVSIITVGININAETKEEFFGCMSDNVDKYFLEADFHTLPSLSDPISQLIYIENEEIVCEDNKNMIWNECGTYM